MAGEVESLQDGPEVVTPVTPMFSEMNPAIQALVMMYLTGNIPHRTVITDERFVRSPHLNASDKVEVTFDGEYNPALLQTTITINVFINGVLTTPWTPWKEAPTDAT